MTEFEYQPDLEHEQQYQEVQELDINTLKRGDKLMLEMVDRRDETGQQEKWATLTIDVTGVRKDGLRVNVVKMGREYEEFKARLRGGMSSPAKPPGHYKYAFVETPGVIKASTTDEVTAILFSNRKYLASSDSSLPIGSTAAAPVRFTEIGSIKKLIR